VKKNTLIVCDPDSCYAEKLTEYLNEHSGGTISAEVFTDPERLLTWLKDASADVLLISSAFLTEEYAKELAQVFTGTCIALTEEKEEGIPADHDGAVTASVDKYQSGEAILSSLQEYCHVRRPEKKVSAPVRKKLHVIAVFSPAGRCGKTSFCIGLGEILAGTGRSTLYINAEEYSGFSDLFGQNAGGDLSDVIFSIRRSGSDRRAERDDPVQMLHARTAVFEALRYIPPARTPVDVREIRITEWEKLIELADGTGEYEYLILDLGTHQNDLFELLELCDFICVPMPEDAVSAAKLHQFRECLHLLDHEALEGKMCVLYLPEIDGDRSEGFPQNLTGGKMGSCIRKFLRSPQWTGMQETGWQAARRERYPDVLSERDRRRDENV
jgi:Mrp family chromosome partitioning ATPase